MAIELDSAAPGFEARFAAFLTAKREQAGDVEAAVRGIISEVRARGDAALIELTQRFDHIDLREKGIRVGAAEISLAARQADPATMAALELARERIEAHHRRQLPQDERYSSGPGVELGHKWTAIDSAGLYVPGGTASYPSTVLMNAVPAKVAGVERLAIAAPAPRGEINPLVLAAAHLAGIDEIYRIGGAQAVAALAFGTESVMPVAKITGPGNAYVAAAKRQVFGMVGIDMIAGPSEVLIIADSANDPAWIAADLLAQAEHDMAAQAILLTAERDFAAAVEAAVKAQLAVLPRGAIAAASWETHGAVILVADLEQAPALVNRLAPEHVQIATRDPEALLPQIRNAGAIFLGGYTPEAIGDYVAGSNHVLPTGRSARFSSGLSVLDFMKRTSILKLDQRGLQALGPAAMTLARAEGLEAHSRSVAIRLDGGNQRPGRAPAS